MKVWISQLGLTVPCIYLSQQSDKCLIWDSSPISHLEKSGGPIYKLERMEPGWHRQQSKVIFCVKFFVWFRSWLPPHNRSCTFSTFRLLSFPRTNGSRVLIFVLIFDPDLWSLILGSWPLIHVFSTLPTFRLLSFPPTDGPGVRLIWVAAGSRHYQHCGQLPDDDDDDGDDDDDDNDDYGDAAGSHHYQECGQLPATTITFHLIFHLNTLWIHSEVWIHSDLLRALSEHLRSAPTSPDMILQFFCWFQNNVNRGFNRVLVGVCVVEKGGREVGW